MEGITTDALVWLGIIFCITQSAIFSGLNLALLGISRLRLEVEVSAGNPQAKTILELRTDFHFLLTTILWGNVSINVLLALLSGSVMTGVSAFLFSTVLITFLGEIAPQAYFSRHAMRMGAMLAPLLRIYQMVLYPVAKPSALVFDKWLGAEALLLFKERDLRTVISKHIEAKDSDVDHIEGIGALNFLTLDDIKVVQEGEAVDAESVISLPMEQGLPKFPEYQQDVSDPFLIKLNNSKKKWIIITDESNQPSLVLNADDFLREAMFGVASFNPYRFCHRPIIIRDASILLGQVLPKLKVGSKSGNVIDDDLILIWSEEKRIITGADILGRLLQGIVLPGDASAKLAL